MSLDHGSILSDIAVHCKRFSELLNNAGATSKEYVLLGHLPDGSDPVTQEDFIGSLEGRNPLQPAAVVSFVGLIDNLADQEFVEGLTYRQAIFAMGRASR